MNGLELQDFLFHHQPSRLELLNYKATKEGKKIQIHVYRNHSFEPIEHTITPYLDYAGLQATFSYSDYDDSLSFLQINPQADLLVLWLDLSRYKNAHLEQFITQRLQELKKTFKKPILFVGVGQQISLPKEVAFTFDVAKIADTLGAAFYDERLEAITGTKLSRQACLSFSKELGLNYFPSLVLPNLKAVFVDLDHTLYQGVLGEDGIENLKLTEGHKRLQEQLKQLAKQGYFLCVVSKNELADVEKLFNSRPDFPLQKKDFTKICASWDPKPAMMSQLLKFLNINQDSVLFIDDNIGEVTAVQGAYPDMKIILAQENANETADILAHYPRLKKFASNQEDLLRAQDTQANELRRQAQATLSPEDYIKSLQMVVTFSFDNPAQAPRVAELSNKTNQFIFSYKRYTLPQVEEMMKNPDYCVLSLRLKDKLSDSGIIGVLVVKKETNVAHLEECFISCRALGRGIDQLMILYSLQQALDRLGCTQLQVHFVRGERNLPAHQFVEQYLGDYLNKPAPFSYHPPKDWVTFEFN